MSEMPEPWRTWMEARGFEPTYRRLAREAELGVETVRQAIIGKERRPSPETVRRLAVALEQSARTIDKNWGSGGSDLEPYEAPAASARLTPKQRKALDSLILAMVEPEERKRPARSDNTELHRKLDDTIRSVLESEAEGPPQDAYGLAANTQRLGPSPKRARRAQQAAEGSQEPNPTSE